MNNSKQLSKILLCLLLIVGNLSVIAQANQAQIDSVTLVAKTAKHDTVKFNALSELNWIYGFSDPSKAKEIGYQEIILSYKLSELYKAQAYNDIAIAFFKLTMLDSALIYNKKALEIRQKTGRKDLIASSLAKIGAVHTEAGNYKEALNATLHALTILEKINDKPKMALIYNNVGQLYEKFNQHDMVKLYAEKSLRLCEEVGDEYGQANAKSALASYYLKHNDSEKAFKLMNEIIQTYLKYDDSLTVAATYNNMGYMYRLIGKKQEGKRYYLMAIDIANKAKDLNGVLMYKYNLSNILREDGDYKQAEKLALEVLQNTTKDNIQQLLINYRGLATVSAYLGKGKEAEKYLDEYVILKDSIFTKDNASMLARLQTVYETEKQSLEIKNLEKDKALQSAEIKKRNQTIMAIAVGLLLLIVLLFVILKSYRQNKKANELITQQKQFVEMQRDQLQSQNLIIEEKKKEILDSINYARRIQEAILPPKEVIKQHFPESFVYYQPKDIVAGDFYWLDNTTDARLIAVADCTGHGVPGAFMSLLGKENLDKSLLASASPGGILNELNRNIKRALKQNAKEENATRDGMDIALIKVQGTKVWYSGANRPLWIKRKNNQGIEELKATKSAIGGFTDDSQVYEEHLLELQKGDMIYMFTDGYPDQFGGDKQKKLTTKRLKEIFLEISSQSTLEQSDYLKTFMDNWRKSTEQIDDILIIGIRI